MIVNEIQNEKSDDSNNEEENVFKTVVDKLKAIENSSKFASGIINNYLNENELNKYNNFKKWLKDNGAIFSKIDFPVLFNRTIGCQAIKTIPQNTAIFYIPYKLIIDSSKISYENIPKSLNKNNTIKLIMFLIEEYKKGEESFYKPYLDIIMMTNFKNYTPFWEKKDFEELNDKDVIIHINDYKNEIDDIYQQIKSSHKDYKNLDYILFKKFYVFVLSRQFNINDKIMFLIPLADLLNHSPSANIKYEIFDSKSYVMKYTRDINEDIPFTEDENLFRPTNCSEYYEILENNIEYSEDSSSKSLIKKRRKQIIPEINVNYGDIKDDIKIDNGDYFVISTNNEQIFRKGEQVFNNYGECSNEYLLINYGFCLLVNESDKTKLTLNLKNSCPYAINYFVENNFEDFLNPESYRIDKIIEIGVKIKSFKIGKKVSKLVRFIAYLGRGDILYYKFTKKEEIFFLDKFIEILQQSIDEKPIEIFKSINILLEQGSDKNNYSDVQICILIYKLTQKLNLIYLKEALTYMRNIMMDDYDFHNIHSYEELIEGIKKNTNHKSIYLNKDYLQKICINYLNKIIKSKK